MRVFFYTSHKWGLQEWDYRNPEGVGIGGSETAQVELAWRMARRGYEVICYAPLPQFCPPVWRGTRWYHSSQADFSQPGLWVLCRCPEVIDEMGPRRDDQQRWVVCQDTDYPYTLTEERAAEIDRFLVLCPIHAEYIVRRHPYIEGKVVLSGNGIRSDVIRETLKQELPERDPGRLIWTSSPDRGLETLLRIYKRVREFVPTLSLDIFYGWDNINTIIKRETNPYWSHLKATILKLLDQPGVTWHGRVGQEQLYQEILKSALWVYPTSFSETGCISVMEAQALGAIPITIPYWALAHNVGHGVFIEGHADREPLVRSRYVGEVIRLASDQRLQDQIRRDMMLGAMMRFNWENIVNQYEALLGGYEDRAHWGSFGFQLKHAKGRILNVGSADDPAEFRARQGATNIDLYANDMLSGRPNPIDYQMDARHMTFEEEFDTVLIGDVLTHMQDTDARMTLMGAKRALVKGGRIVLTMSCDDRPRMFEPPEWDAGQQYTEGMKLRPVKRDRLAILELIKSVGLSVVQWETIDYGFCEGWGFIVQ